MKSNFHHPTKEKEMLVIFFRNAWDITYHPILYLTYYPYGSALLAYSRYFCGRPGMNRNLFPHPTAIKCTTGSMYFWIRTPLSQSEN